MSKLNLLKKIAVFVSVFLSFFVSNYAMAITRAPGNSTATSSPLQPLPEGVSPNVTGAVEYSHPVRPGDNDGSGTTTGTKVGNTTADNSSNSIKLGFASNGFNWVWLVGIIIVGFLVFGVYRAFKKQDEN